MVNLKEFLNMSTGFVSSEIVEVSDERVYYGTESESIKLKDLNERELLEVSKYLKGIDMK